MWRMLKKGYDRTRKQAEKREIVLGVKRVLEKKFGRSHDELAIVKKWSDLKRRHPDWVKELSERVCPGLPVPTVRRRITTADLDLVEVSAEEEEEDDQAGPSHSRIGASNPPDVGNDEEVAADVPGPSEGPKTSGPAPAEENIPTPAPDEEDEELITTPHQEVINKIDTKIANMKERLWKTIMEFRAHIRKSQKMLQEFHDQYGEDLKELTGLQKQRQNLP
ncbi:uncharacterized protein LOC120993741 [Bufo bufo]|uniref:uncharacterized protein LOC120993741 n=1 Tax=Bufo bufo TaxID=8384 RepID=UPI001ABE31C2|nr:uncharacterized protein LOC120993741 [Bufo bufo]